MTAIIQKSGDLNHDPYTNNQDDNAENMTTKKKHKKKKKKKGTFHNKETTMELKTLY